MQRHQYIFISSILFCMLVFLLPITIAGSSLAMGAICILSLLFFILFPVNFDRANKVLFISFIGYFLLTFLSMLYTDNQQMGWQKVLLKLPLLFVPFIYWMHKRTELMQKLYFEQLFIWMAVFIAFISTIHYYRHKELLDFLVLQNKPIPVLTHIYHIEYSIILALAIVLAVYRLLFFKWSSTLWQWLYLTAAVIGLYSIHIMSVRTGLLCLYVGVSVLGLAYVVQFRRFKFLIALPLAFALLVGIGYQFSESFHNRIELTLDDVDVMSSDRDRNFHSVSMRLDAFKNGIKVFKKHPITGVGVGDVDTAIMFQFAKDSSSLHYENRKKPHHQFLENGLQSGMASPLLLLLILLLPLCFLKYRNPMSIAFVGMLFFAMQFESILERQATLAVFCILYVYFISLKEQ